MDTPKKSEMADILLQKLNDPSLLMTSGLVDGEERKDAAGKTFPVIEPSSGKVLNWCADLSKKDLIDALDSAQVGSAKLFESTTAKQRGLILKEFCRLILLNADDCKCPSLSPPPPIESTNGIN
jgi:succinate-semialdehyde dehydrogenase/glutarate-semialdehyde dehydrogenase